MTTLGSSTTAEFIGYWLVEGSDATSWIANNSPNSLELSGLTEGLSYIKLTRLVKKNEQEIANFLSWDTGDGESTEFTYGDDKHTKTISNKLRGGLANMYTEKGYFRRFKKTHNRGTADNVYLFNRFDTSANAYEPFYSDDLSALKYVPVLVQNTNFQWSQETNLKTIVNLTVKEIWRS